MIHVRYVVDVDAFAREIAAATREVFAGDWHVGALGPTDADPRWTVAVRQPDLVTPLFVVREPTLAEGLCGLAARVLEAATERRHDYGRAIDELVCRVNEIANHGVLA